MIYKGSLNDNNKKEHSRGKSKCKVPEMKKQDGLCIYNVVTKWKNGVEARQIGRVQILQSLVNSIKEFR